MSKKTIWAVTFLIVVLGIIFLNKKPAKSPADDIIPSDGFPPVSEMIEVMVPINGDTVDATNGFEVNGKAKGGWYFEASAPTYVYDKNNNLLASSHITAKGDWMTTNFSDFSGEFQPFLTNGATDGYILFENDNPSGDEGFRRSLKINVKFPTQETQSIKLYFSNTKNDPNMLDCSKVYEVSRTIPKSTGIAKSSIVNLLTGPNQKEVDDGYVSAFGRSDSQSLKSIKIVNGVATVDFNYLPSGGSCLVAGARAQIEQTLKQFETIKTIKILLNGDEASALQP